MPPQQSCVAVCTSTVNFKIFVRNCIFANSVKRHICDAKISQLGHDLPISVNDRMGSPFFKGFLFTKLRLYAKFPENKTLANISELAVYKVGREEKASDQRLDILPILIKLFEYGILFMGTEPNSHDQTLFISNKRASGSLYHSLESWLMR